ncbi:NAD(P)-dependent oxidoreductase [Gemella sp. GH3]|uniref:NAD(P)-dependent oxidoreductase n=1 Tax=unclassified Gemella TaxID=2624949 RepID=UPI0015D08C7D|nr:MULTISPECIES: NAD(P)-dependent oxidoreductase [unclassified Gemella]MBF0714553.1 NAD(P)-dependent oxidoreductase [Gemella sp. GH3.1]NYS51505.1 NAD(P)-dependent oxidoreductase [Gemella sp. GH3]
MNIAWIGVGVMGESIINHLLNAGHNLFVYNRTVSKCENVVNNGAILLNNISDAPKNADIIFTMVGYPKDVEEVYLGENGLLTTTKSNQIFVDLTTSSPELAQKIAEKLAEIGSFGLDIPVTGGDIGAKNGTLTLLAGGNKEILDKISPILNTFSSSINYFGKSGNGQRAKLGNQVAIATTMISLAESYTFAKNQGLDVEKFLETISKGAASSFSMSAYYPRILNNDYKPGFFIHHFLKDMKLALDECEKANIKLPGLNLAYDMYNSLSEDIKYSEGTQSIIKYYK